LVCAMESSTFKITPPRQDRQNQSGLCSAISPPDLRKWKVAKVAEAAEESPKVKQNTWPSHHDDGAFPQFRYVALRPARYTCDVSQSETERISVLMTLVAAGFMLGQVLTPSEWAKK